METLDRLDLLARRVQLAIQVLLAPPDLQDLLAQKETSQYPRQLQVLLLKETHGSTRLTLSFTSITTAIG